MAETAAEKADKYTVETMQKSKEVAEQTAKVMQQSYEKSKVAAEDTAKAVQQSYATASKGTVDFNLKLIEMAQDHMNAAFDFARQLGQVKSPSEFFELSTLHARKQFEKLAAQSQHLTGLAQKGMTETAQSFQTGIDNVSKRT